MYNIYYLILCLFSHQIECLSTTTSRSLIATSTLHGNIVVWDVETHLKVSDQYHKAFIFAAVCLFTVFCLLYIRILY